MTEVKFDVSYEQIRSLVVESLGTYSQGQITSFHLHIARLFIQRGIVPDRANSGAFNRPSQYELSSKHKSWIDDIIWDLIIEGVVRSG